MNNIQVESTKSFYSGFVLSEQELRRILEVIEDQFKKNSTTNFPKHVFKLKFGNGATADINDIEDIFKIENVGSSKIIRLQLTSTLEINEVVTSEVKVIFNNADEDKLSVYTSLAYAISGTSRDWVFVTSSLLEERINKIKRWAPNAIGEGGGRRNPFRRSIYFLLIWTLPFLLLIIPDLYLKKQTPLTNTISNIEKRIKNKDTIDVVSVIIEIEKSKIEENKSEKNLYAPKGWFGLNTIVIIVLVLGLGGWFLMKYYPVYNFLWGDYVTIFERKESIRKTVFYVIVIGLLISIIGGVIANLTGIGK